MNQASARSKSVHHFLVMEILERARVLEAAGADIVHLEVGEPDFNSPREAVSAAIGALDAGRTHYTHSLGDPSLREAIALRHTKEYGIDVDPDRIVVTTGSSAALLLAFAAVMDPGDDLLVSDPGYACYPNICRSLGCNPVPVAVGKDTGFALAPDVVAEHITPRTKAVVLNSPANPTGTLTPPESMRSIAELGITTISDEIYHGLVYEGAPHTMLEFDPDAFVVNGFSKRFAMTGWRLGYLIVPTDFVRPVQALQQNIFISASDFGQSGALAALDADAETESMRRQFDERRRYMVDALTAIGLEIAARPVGAFYVFVDTRRFAADSLAFAIELLEQAHVAVAPGIDFGSRGEGHLRFSYATSLDRIGEGVDRISRHLSKR